MLFALAGIFVWVVNAAIDAYILRLGSLAEQMFPATHEVCMRATFLMCLLLLGTLIAVLHTKTQTAELKLRHINSVLSCIRDLEHDLSSETDIRRMAQRTCDDLVNGKAYSSAWIVVTDPLTGRQIVAGAGIDKGFEAALKNLQYGHVPACVRTVMSISDVMIIKGAEHNCPDCALGPIYRGTGSMLARMESGGKVYGVIGVSMAPMLVAMADERTLFSEVATDMATMLYGLEVEQERRQAEAELARSRRREADLGFRIQQALLFQRPPEDIPGTTIAAITVPSQQVDGDFYDFFRHNDQCFDILIADVMGKGTTAALVGAAAKSQFLRATSELIAAGLVGGKLPRPREIVNSVHRQMTRQLIELENFVTLFYARFDLVRGLVTFVDCGHTKPIHYRAASGEYELLEGNNTFLGGKITEDYQQISRKIEAGDILVFYSDGMVDVENKDKQFYGFERLADLIRANGTLEPPAMIDKLLMDVVSFSLVESPRDDMTCVVVKIQKIQPEPPLLQAELEISSSLVELARVRAFILSLARRVNPDAVGEHDVSRLELAINEAVSNIMRHAYHGRNDQRIRIEADVFAEQITVRLWHWGEPYDPATANPPQPRDSQATGGFGLSIIAQCADEVQYIPAQKGRSCVVLVKKFNT